MTSSTLRFIVAASLHFFTVAGIVLSRTYMDLLFLSTYSIDWLPYFFVGQTVVLLALTFSITPFISKGSFLINFFILILLALSAVGSSAIIAMNIPGAPFAISLWISALSVILGVMSWNVVGDAFDVRKFKTLIKWIASAGSIGGLCIGLMIPFFLIHYPSEYLLYVLAALILSSALCVLNLKPVKVSKMKPTTGTSPTKYPLFRNIAVVVFLMMIVDTMADYALKVGIAENYKNEEIGQFLGPFYGISIAITLAVQLGATNPILRKFGLTVLLLILPVFCFVGGLGLFLIPLLWAATVFRLGEIVFGYSVDTIGREIVSNPLPAQVRRKSKLFLKGVVTPLGTGVGALLLWIISLITPQDSQLAIRVVAVVAVLATIAWIWIVCKTKKVYKKALKDAIKSKRFGKDSDEISDADRQAAKELAMHALDEEDPDAIIFGLGLIREYHDDAILDSLYQHLGSESSIVRMETIKTVKALKDYNSVPRLIERVSLEEDQEIQAALMEVLSELDPEKIVDHAAVHLNSTVPRVKAGAILVLLRAGNLDHIIDAGIALKEMINSSDSIIRKGAARVLGSLQAGKMEKELEKLINDSNIEVCITAIRSAGSRKVYGLTPLLVSKLGAGRISRYASRALVSLGISVGDVLLEQIDRKNYTRSRVIMKTLASIPDEKIEDIFTSIIENGDIVIRTMAAREVVFRAHRQVAGDRFKTKSREFALLEHHTIQLLKAAETGENVPVYVKIELAARQKLACLRFLYFVGTCTIPSEIIEVKPILLPDEFSVVDSSQKAAALELLETISPDSELKKAIAVFENKSPFSSNEALDELRQSNDPWLDQVLNFELNSHKDEKMNITHKALILRKTKLFESLPGEILLTIAEKTEERELVNEEKLFSQDDYPDGLYIIAAGSVKIVRKGEILTELKEGDFFGEISLFDDSPRGADAIASADSHLLFIENNTFDSITEDLPEVLRAVMKTLIGYLKTSPAKP